MRKTFLVLFSSLISLLLSAQEYNRDTPKLKITDLDYPEYSKQIRTTDNPSNYFKTMIGDTIIFKGTSNREDFLRPDTLWIKPNAKKPVEGKHYRVTKHYKTTDNDNTTPAQFIYEKPWIIVSYEEGEDDSVLWKYECLVLRDAESGELIKWQYLSDYKFSENIDIVNVSKSREVIIDLFTTNAVAAPPFFGSCQQFVLTACINLAKIEWPFVAFVVAQTGLLWRNKIGWFCVI